MKVVALVLAAGASTRFGSSKLLAPLNGQPVLQHTLDAVADAALSATVVVLGDTAPAVEAAIAWRGERRVVNPRPQDGLGSSLRLGLDAAAEDPTVDAVLVVLGDQPTLRAAVIRALVAAADGPGPAQLAQLVRPQYADDPAPNPLLVRRAAWAVAAGLSGDRGLGPLLAKRPDLVAAVAVEGANPDIDTPDDLARIARTLPDRPYPSLPNFRDIGGHPTISGARVRRGLVYRSTIPANLTPHDTARLLELGIQTVYDLRSDGERSQRPVAPGLPRSINYVVADVVGDSGLLSPMRFLALLDNPATVREMLGDGRADAQFEDKFRRFVDSATAQAAYRTLFAGLADAPKLPAVFHCTTGKDRTGWAAAALQTLLGVPAAIVMSDFVASTEALAPMMAPFVARYVDVGGDAADITPLLGVSASYLEAGLDEVQRLYGTIEGYFTHGLGLDAAVQARLRFLLLEPA